MKNLLSNFGISDKDPSVVEATTNLKILASFQEQIKNSNELLKRKVADQILVSLFYPIQEKISKKEKDFLSKDLFGMIYNSFYFTEMGEVKFISFGIHVLCEVVSLPDMNPEEFAESLNSKWVDEKTGASLAKLTFIKKPEQEWKDYKGKVVQGYFSLMPPSKD
jgi:hypothetical protein